MIGEKFEYEGKSYSIKRDVSFGEYKKISHLGNSLHILTREYEEADEDKKQVIIEEFTRTTDSQLEIMSNFIETILGLKQSDIDKMSLFTAVGLFNKAFELSTQIKKKLEKISDLPSS